MGALRLSALPTAIAPCIEAEYAGAVRGGNGAQETKRAGAIEHGRRARSQWFIAATVVLASACASTPGDETEDPLGAFLRNSETLGYAVTRPLGELEPAEWASERANNRTSALRRARIKSNFPAEIGTFLYYHFEIDELTTPDYGSAHQRWRLIQERPESTDSEDPQVFILQRGFTSGSKVYRVTTEVRRFDEALDVMTRDLADFLRASPEERTGVVEAARSRTAEDLRNRLVQSALAEAGLYRGPIDGLIGRGSRNAIARFRSTRGLGSGEAIDAPLLGALGLPDDAITYFNERASQGSSSWSLIP